MQTCQLILLRAVYFGVVMACIPYEASVSALPELIEINFIHITCRITIHMFSRVGTGLGEHGSSLSTYLPLVSAAPRLDGSSSPTILPSCRPENGSKCINVSFGTIPRIWHCQLLCRP